MSKMVGMGARKQPATAKLEEENKRLITRIAVLEKENKSLKTKISKKEKSSEKEENGKE